MNDFLRKYNLLSILSSASPPMRIGIISLIIILGIVMVTFAYTPSGDADEAEAIDKALLDNEFKEARFICSEISSSSKAEVKQKSKQLRKIISAETSYFLRNKMPDQAVSNLLEYEFIYIYIWE